MSQDWGRIRLRAHAHTSNLQVGTALHLLVSFRCLLSDLISQNLRACSPPSLWGLRVETFVFFWEGQSAITLCSGGRPLRTEIPSGRRVELGRGNTEHALPPSRGASPESASMGIQGRSPKCPSQASGDSSPSCGVGPGSALETFVCLIASGPCRPRYGFFL